MKRLQFSRDNLSIECTEREYQQVQEFKRLDFCSSMEKIFTYMLVYEVRWRLKVVKNISTLMKILATKRFMLNG